MRPWEEYDVDKEAEDLKEEIGALRNHLNLIGNTKKRSVLMTR